MLLANEKPVALFTGPLSRINIEQIRILDQAVAQGTLVRLPTISVMGQRLFYCQPDKLADMHELAAIYERLDQDGLRPRLEDHHRIGTLLGYRPEDIAAFEAAQIIRLQAPKPL